MAKAKLYLIQDAIDAKKRKAAKLKRHLMFTQVREACEEHGDDLSGMALIVWDKAGQMNTYIMVGDGPYDSQALPTMAACALTQHTTMQLLNSPAVTVIT